MTAFEVLGIPTDASRIEVERAGQKLLAQLEIGAKSVKFIGDGSGGRRIERTPELVRGALTTLRDPNQRLEAELIALATPVELPAREGVDVWAELGLGMTRPATPPE